MSGAHIRRVIRAAAVSALKNARTAAGTRVFNHPYRPRTVFPALVVEDFGANYSESNVTESQEQLSFDGDLMRHYRFVVIAEIEQSDNAADERDDLVGEVEVALAEALAAGLIPDAKSIEPKAYVAADSNDGQTPIRRGLQVFEVTYITPGDDPTTTNL